MTKRKKTRAKRSRVTHHLKKQFIPHEENGHLPYALRHKRLLAYSIALIALKLVSISLPLLLPAGYLYSSAVTPANIIQLTNDARASVGLAPVALNGTLTAAAQAKADDILARQYFAHVDPDGKQAWDWIHGAGYVYKYAGENLAIYFKDAESVTAGWLASATHKANLLGEQFNEIGVGVAHGVFDGYDTAVVVQFFGTPRGVEPVNQPVPVQTPEEVPKLASAPAEDIHAPVIEEATIMPEQGSVRVTAVVPNAEEVRVVSNEEVVPLQQEENGEWTARVELASTEALRLMARSRSGDESIVELASFYENAETPDVFASFNSTQRTFLKHWTLQDMQKGVDAVYVYAMVMLATLLLLAFFVKIHIQHWTILAHAIAVTSLAFFLFLL